MTHARLAGMSAAFATSNIARTAISFATSLVIARVAGVEAFGRWTLCMAWAAMLTTLFDLGFGVLLTRDAARGDTMIGRAVGAAFVLRLGLLIPVALPFVAAPHWLSADPETVRGLAVAPLIAAAGIAYGCLAPVFRARPGALVAILSIETAGAVLQWGGTWWLLETGAGVFELLVLVAAIQALQFAAALSLWRPIAKPAGRIERPSPSVLLETLRTALPFAAAGLIANAQQRIAPILLGLLAGPAALAAFGAAARIGGLARLVPQAAFAGALPVLTQEAVQGSRNGLRGRFDRTLVAFSLAAAAVIVTVAGPIVTFAYGDEFAGAVPPLMWVGAGLLPTLVNSGRKVYLYAAGAEHAAVRWSAVALGVQIAAGTAMVPSFGASGAAAGLAIGEALVWWPLRQAAVKPRELSGGPVGVMSDSPLTG
jgi:O-antigen/teichoic acid export membrane protein